MVASFEIYTRFLEPIIVPSLVVEDPAEAAYIEVSVQQTLYTPVEQVQQPTSTVPAEPGETLIETVTPTYTPEPTEVDFSATQTAHASTAKDLIDEGLAHLDKVKDYYDDHDCEHWIEEASKAVEKCNQAVELNSGNSEAYFCLGVGKYYLEELPDAATNFGNITEEYLSQEQVEEMRNLNQEMIGRLVEDPCAIGPVQFNSGWDSNGYPIGQSDKCRNISKEI